MNFGKIQRPQEAKIAIATTPLSFDAPYPANPNEYLHNLYILTNNSLCATFLPLTEWVYLHSNFSDGL